MALLSLACSHVPCMWDEIWQDVRREARENVLKMKKSLQDSAVAGRGLERLLGYGESRYTRKGPVAPMSHGPEGAAGRSYDLRRPSMISKHFLSASAADSRSESPST